MDGVFDEALSAKLASSKVLMVGAGGIGCELLKCLVQSGFKNVEIIDLDTIDVSNLNRQFLFRKEHVKQPKAIVARASILQHYPEANITAHVGSIIDTKYGINWFKEFDVVLMALDNISARSHVNRMCINADTILIDSGTAGYLGQVDLHVKGISKCFECYPLPRPKSFPNCTIRDTPSEPIHCIVWAKHVFNQLFGLVDIDTEMSTVLKESDGENNDKKLSEPVKDLRSYSNWKQVFTKLFRDDITYLLRMHDLWTTRQAPTPFNIDTMATEDIEEQTSTSDLLPDQRLWSMKECVDFFATSYQDLKQRYEVMVKNNPDGYLIWDKDDKASMDFVAAMANIRSHVFHIRRQSRYDIKAMAGNIIPAIATSNAIIAAATAYQAIRAIGGNMRECRTIYLRSTVSPDGYWMIRDHKIINRNPNCFVCSEKPQVCIALDAKKTTLKQLRENILISHFDMVLPEVSVGISHAVIISSEEEDREEAHMNKKLLDFNVKDGSVLYVEDFLQNCNFSMFITDKEMEDETLFEVVGSTAMKLERERGKNSDTQAGQKRKSDVNSDERTGKKLKMTN